MNSANKITWLILVFVFNFIAVLQDILKKMKTIYSIIIILLLLNSCVKEKNPLIGKWIENDNYVNPIYAEISKDSCSINHTGTMQKVSYEIKKDTFLLNMGYHIYKMKFTFRRKLLKFHSVDSDSLSGTFERFEQNNYIDFFNTKKHTTVELPRVPGKKINYRTQRNAIACEYNRNGEFIIFRNGKNYLITDNSFIKLLPDADDYWKSNSDNLLFCDKNIKVKDLNLIKNELIKGLQKSITYVTLNGNTLQGIKIPLPFNSENLPDSLRNSYPLSPPQPELHELTSTGIVCFVRDEIIEVNNVPISEVELIKLIEYKSTNVKGFVITVYFDENMNFEKYLIKRNMITNIFYKIRNSYSKQRYNEINYKNLDINNIKEINKKFPMSIRELNRDEYYEVRKYAL